MKKLIWLFLMLLIGGSASAGILDLKIGPAQAFDVQYYWSNSSNPGQPNWDCYNDPSPCDRLNVSGLTTPYASAGSAQWTQPQLTSGQYYKFFNSITNPGTYGLGIYNADGSLAMVMHDTGDFYKLGSDAIFYVGGGFFGTVITTTAGYSYGSSAVLDVGLGTPTSQDFANYTPPSNTVLAAGQTASTGGGGGNGSTSGGGGSVPAGPVVDGGTITQTNAPTDQIIISGSSGPTGPTSNQQTRIDTWTNRTGSYNNEIYIEQTYGQNNSVTLVQEGYNNRIDFTLDGNGNAVSNTQTGSNYLKIDVPGWGNNIVTNQNNTVGTNYAETKIQGNGNTVNHQQTGNANQLLFSNIQGDINTVTTIQSGSGSHYAESKILGNWNNVKIDQSGNVANRATVDVTNAGGAVNVDIQQSGGKSFGIVQTCINPAGCSTVIRQ